MTFCTAGDAESAAVTEDSDDDDDDADKHYKQLSSTVSTLKSQAVRSSHRLTDTERLTLMKDITATVNILLNCRGVP